MTTNNEPDISNAENLESQNPEVLEIPDEVILDELDSPVLSNEGAEESVVEVASDEPLNEESVDESMSVNSPQEPVSDSAPDEVLPEIPAEENSVVDLESRINLASEQRAKITKEIEEFEALRENLSIEIERFNSVREDLNQWIGARKESFAWKLTEALRVHEKQLTVDETSVREFAANDPLLDTDFGAKTRRWVMKSIGFTALVGGAIFFIMEYLRTNSGFVEAPDPNNPAATIQVREFDRWLLENLGLTHIQVTLILITTMILIFTGVLFAYSRRSSEFRQKVAEEAQMTKVMEHAVHSIKIEREKIDSLHPQVPQILELLSLGLHQPWLIDDRYLAFQGDLPDASKLPESLDISVPTEKSSRRVFPQLVLRALNQIQQPGWREQAFEKTIQGLAEHAGFGESGAALRELDQDQRRSGKRQMLIRLEDKDSVLTEIGEELVKKFAAVVQAKVLPFAQPDVISLRPDVLSQLQLTNNLVDTSEESVSSWEHRLSEIAGAGSPWAPGTFSTRGQLAARHERKPVSVFIASDRASQLAHTEVVAFREIGAGTRPFEVSIRVDLSEWCHPEELAIFEDYEPSAEELRQRELREKKEIKDSDIMVQPQNNENLAF
jgi:hypothetical protein